MIAQFGVLSRGPNLFYLCDSLFNISIQLILVVEVVRHCGMDLRKMQTGILAADFVRVPMVGQVIKYDFDNFRGSATDNRRSCRVGFNTRVRRSSHVYNFNFGLGSNLLLHFNLLNSSGVANFIDTAMRRVTKMHLKWPTLRR